jgi:processive 1,2-diacylglycerol beta-glucosyltransferase
MSEVILLKILILSTATGQGHNSAAASIREYLETQKCDVTVLDVLKSGEKDVSTRVSRLYANITVHIPQFFGFLYHLGELLSSSKRRSPVYFANSLYAGSLYKKIRSIEPDVIVCSHLFGGEALTYISAKYGYSVPTAAIVTDYTCSPFWEETRLDSYIIPTPVLEDEFVSKGIPKEKIVSIGIPVKSNFQTDIPKDEARKAFGLSAKHVFLIMSGSMGYGQVKKLALSLSDAVPDAEIVVLCGRNKDLYNTLTGLKNIKPFEYIDNVNVIMDAADVLLTKPGGLSSTEALVKRIPIVFTSPIPGCETKNAELLSSYGMAAKTDTVESAVAKAVELLFNPESAQRMLKAQREHIQRDSAKQIGDYLIGLCREYRANQR